ncbi:MAG: aminotransferase class I/II-fold pyridoxal phosphate-dependent enzyme [Clostridiales bacterium]|nr:aminotransferase class I/II-fold pyridoxal phosphate-dependent enzyme [Clostridiales bacterium]
MKSWKDNLRKIEPYTPGEQSKAGGVIKLNANENPYPPSPAAAAAIKNFDAGALRLYPDAGGALLKNAIAEYYGVESKNVFIGNGSDDVIAVSFQALFSGDKPILFPDITYSFYPVWCSLFDIKYKTCPLDSNFRINLNDYRAENGGIIIPNPNAPTSLGEGREFIRQLMSFNKSSVVIIDEAYVDFGGMSSICLTREYENLLITGTFSKSRSLAGLRIGFAIGSETLISALEAVKNSYNSYTVDSIAMAAGAAAIKDDEYFKSTVKKITDVRKKTASQLQELGFKVLESQTNFLFATHSNADMKDYFNYLKTQKVFIRYFDLPRINNYVRITIGTEKDMCIFIEKTRQYLKNH